MWCDDCHGRDSEYDGRDLPRALAIVEAADRLVALFEARAVEVRHSCEGFCPFCAAVAAYRKARDG